MAKSSRQVQNQSTQNLKRSLQQTLRKRNRGTTFLQSPQRSLLISLILWQAIQQLWQHSSGLQKYERLVRRQRVVIRRQQTTKIQKGCCDGSNFSRILRNGI